MPRCASCSTPPTTATSGSSSTGCSTTSGRGFWPFHHVLEAGGASPYRDWFYLEPEVVAGGAASTPTASRAAAATEERGYRSWWDVPALPKLRVEHPEVREYLSSVAEHWLRFGIDGWRLDVPQDIEDETFWPEFRQPRPGRQPGRLPRRRDLGRGPEWLAGDRFDALMNYPLGIAILGFAGGRELDMAVVGRPVELRAGRWSTSTGRRSRRRLERQLTLYDPAVTAVQFNLIGSHDTPRARIRDGRVDPPGSASRRCSS